MQITCKRIQIDFETIQHIENNSICICQYHSARYRRMQVELFLHVQVFILAVH